MFVPGICRLTRRPASRMPQHLGAGVQGPCPVHLVTTRQRCQPCSCSTWIITAWLAACRKAGATTMHSMSYVCCLCEITRCLGRCQTPGEIVIMRWLPSRSWLLMETSSLALCRTAGMAAGGTSRALPVWRGTECLLRACELLWPWKSPCRALLHCLGWGRHTRCCPNPLPVQVTLAEWKTTTHWVCLGMTFDMSSSLPSGRLPLAEHSWGSLSFL